MRALIIYVTGILALWRVMDSLSAWECLCGSPLCEWCACPPPAPEWLYGAHNGSQGDATHVPYMSTYQHHITNPVTCTLDRL